MGFALKLLLIHCLNRLFRLSVMHRPAFKSVSLLVTELEGALLGLSTLFVS